MFTKTPDTLLEQLSQKVNIDVDCLDADFVASLPITPHDMTSNPRFIQEQLGSPANRPMVVEVVKSMPGRVWDEIYPVIVAKLAARVFPHISGRVLAQTLPTHSYDTEYMVKQARAFVKAFKDEGIPTERTCIKVPTTGPAVAAAVILKKEGIATLGTSLFSLHQAIAASQAGMHAISIYFNEPLAAVEATRWPDVEDPASQHPMAARHLRIRQAYDRLAKETGRKQPQLKTASYVPLWLSSRPPNSWHNRFISARETLSMVELGADNITLNKLVLADLNAGPGVAKYHTGQWKVPVSELVRQPHFVWEDWIVPEASVSVERMAKVAKTDPLSKFSDEDWFTASTEVNYLAPGVLDRFNGEDEVTRVRLDTVLARFSTHETESKKYIEDIQAELA
ncbi:hypothetical protein JCM24511_06141 [Saitozyma sp. JCM 24511]|nr:hypothetical protein JCM24511_06141 [Saitozyma sp. JCM 24511]